MRERTWRIAYYGLMTALALILSFLETLIPIPVPIPGIKIGLANLVVVFALVQVGPWAALGLSLCRVLLAALLFSGLSGWLFSMAGALLSWGVMALLWRWAKFSVVGISLAGGLFHNLGQLLTAAAYTHSPGIIPAYLPVLMIAGAVMGVINGLVAAGAIRALKAHPATRAAVDRLKSKPKK